MSSNSDDSNDSGECRYILQQALDLLNNIENYGPSFAAAGKLIYIGQAMDEIRVLLHRHSCPEKAQVDLIFAQIKAWVRRAQSSAR